jgi:hypothetical protein
MRRCATSLELVEASTHIFETYYHAEYGLLTIVGLPPPEEVYPGRLSLAYSDRQRYELLCVGPLDAEETYVERAVG